MLMDMMPDPLPPRPCGARLACCVAMIAAATVAAGCGSDNKSNAASTSTSTSTPTLPFPPVAAEPKPARPDTPKPVGQVIEVGAKPEGVAVDPKSGLAAVTVQSPDGIALVDTRTRKVVRRVRLAASARHVQLAAPGGPFLVPLEASDQLAEVYPSADRKVRITKVGDNPHDAAAIGPRAFVADEFDSAISTVRDGRLLSTVPVDAQPGGIAAVGTKEVAVISVRAYTVQLFTATDRPRPTEGAQNVGYGPSHVVADKDGRLYIADGRGDALTVFATRPRLKFLQHIPLGGSPLGLAVDDARGRVWVTLSDANQLVQLDQADDPKIVKRRSTVPQPNSVGVVPATGEVLVASRSEGTLQFVKP